MKEPDVTPAESAVLVLEEAERLIWALLDDQLDHAETTRLSQLLKEHESVRRRYMECVQLDVNLRDHLAATRTTGKLSTGSPVLPNLMPGVTPGSDAPIAT